MKKIFICGCGHSGTTLLQAIFLAHPECIGIKHESDMFLYGNEHLVPGIMEQIDYQYEKTHYKYYIEKTPRHVRMIKEIYAYVADPAIIVCYKNPLDVVASLCKRGYTLDDAIERYINDNNNWLSLRHEYNLLEVKYESLVNAPGEFISILCGKLGMIFKEEMLLFWQSPDLYFGVDTPSYNTYVDNHIGSVDFDRQEGESHRMFRNFQLKQPISDMSGAWCKILTHNEACTVISSTRHVAEQLGYKYR
jgi:hypothetical protein